MSPALRDVRLLEKAPGLDWETHTRGREQAAYERGRRDGERALGEQMLQQRADFVQLQQGVLASLRQAIPQTIRETERTLSELALAAAQKVVAELPISAEMMEAVVREALAQVEDSAEISVQLHPEDLALLRRQNAPVLGDSPNGIPIRFAPSADVTRGGAIVQTRFGLVDARRETKFEQLQESLNA